MICEKCGTNNADGSKFCMGCGAQLPQGQAPVPPQPIPAPQGQVSVPPQPIPAPQGQASAPPQGQSPIPPQGQWIPPQQMGSSQYGEQPQTQGEKKLHVGLIIGMAALVGVIFIGVMVFLALRSNEADDHTAKKKKTSTEQTVAETEESVTEETVEVVTEATTESVDSPAVAAEPEPGTIEALAYQNGVSLLTEASVEGVIQRKILELNETNYSLQSIDIFADNYAVPSKDDSITWDSTMFYVMEGYSNSGEYFNKNLCNLVKKELINAQTGNVVDYDLYINPNNGVANKIVSIEYISDGIEITEYYFDNNKKVNFIFNYKADNYVSSFATPDKIGERYLFSNDRLATWRVVGENDFIKNYTAGANEAQRLSSSWTSDSIIKYSDMPAYTQSDFDHKEKAMLNAAYNTYEIVTNAEGISKIQGYVYRSDNSPMQDADVDIYANNFNDVMYHASTDANGMYTVWVPYLDYEYNVKVKKDGYTDCDIYRASVSEGQIGSYIDSAYLFDGTQESSVSLTLGDAFNYNSSGSGMMLLDSAQINIRQGINNRYGEIYQTQYTDSYGYSYIPLLNGMYTIEVIAGGYETMYYTISSNKDSDNVYEFYAAPQLAEGEIAIVLTWGAYPYDLDSHLFTTKGSTSDHIWYGDRYDNYDNYLDVDDTSSYGPETTTIRSYSSTDYYKYCVVDFTDCSSGNYGSYEMSSSNAVVNVYSQDGLIGTYHVPANRAGVIWEVFEIRNGQLTPIQRYYDNVEDKSWWNSEK